MKNNKRKIILGFLALMVSSSLVAQGSNNLSERQDMLKKHQLSSSLRMGWYTGAVDSFGLHDLMNKYLPLSNYLTNQVGSLIVLETDKSDREIAKDALAGNFEIVYTSALMGTELVKNGWHPVVGRSDEIRPVVLGLETTKIASVADLKGKKIMATYGATVTAYTQYSLINDKIIKPISEGKDSNFSINKISQQQLLDVLKQKQVDGIVVRDVLASRLIKENPGLYKVLYAAKPSPGHMVFVSPKVDSTKINSLKQSFMQLNGDNKAHKSILSGLDGYNEKDITPFKEVSGKNLDVPKEVFRVLEIPPLN